MSDAIIEAAARALACLPGDDELHRDLAARVLAAVTPLIRAAAYRERNQVVAALARLFPSGLARTDIPGWEPEWHGCVYIDLPTGQVSWHYHDDDAHLFNGLPAYTKPWDGHDTPEKYRRLAVLAAVTPLIRAAALEEAAKVAEDCLVVGRDGNQAREDIAAIIRAVAIRALKEQP